MTSFINDIIVTVRDMGRLTEALRDARRDPRSAQPVLSYLETELRRADLVASSHVPPDVITMNSRFEVLDEDTREVLEMALVYPGDEDPAKHVVSVLSRAGAALLGASVGETVRWRDRAAMRAVTVRRMLYQPEAAGDLHR